MIPLIVTAFMANGAIPAAQTQDIRLDSLLAYVQMQRQNHWTPNRPDQVIPEIPLLALWRDEAGKPLWACSKMFFGESFTSISYRHRRWLRDAIDFCKKPPSAIQMMTGQFKAKRIAYSVLNPVNSEFSWLVIGDKEKVEDYLKDITSIGKNAACGGNVIEWRVDFFDIDIESAKNEILQNRPVPARSGLLTKEGKTSLQTWTPPYWYRPWAEECLCG